MNLDKLAAEAMKRLAVFVARSTGQHLRQMRKTWKQTKETK